MDEIMDIALIAGDELHDGHDSHHSNIPQRRRGDNLSRAIRLANDPITYPARVRVFTSADAIARAQERRELE